MTDTLPPSETLPTSTNILFWKPEEQSPGYRNIAKVFNTQPVPLGAAPVRPLPPGAPLDISFYAHGEVRDLDWYMEANSVAGVIVLKDGKVRTERYARGLTPDQPWVSFSVAKSFTSTLVGCAIADGLIDGLDDQLVRHIPEMKGSAYDGVTVRQLLTMTSGVRWNEDYADPKSDVAVAGREVPADGSHPVVHYMKQLPRESEPGTQNKYSTGETDLTGVLVNRATGKTLAAYLSEKIWSRFGMEAPATWICDKSRRERGGSGLSITLRDYARFGLFMLEGGVVDGKSVVPPGWTREATVTQIPQVLAGGGGYGYQWWTNPDGSYRGSGIFGQGLFIDPALNLVVVTLSTWAKAVDLVLAENRVRFIDGIRDAVRAEA
ncbi:MAG: serine hydrolase [Caulobacteraceae bacterium]